MLDVDVHDGPGKPVMGREEILDGGFFGIWVFRSVRRARLLGSVDEQWVLRDLRDAVVSPLDVAVFGLRRKRAC